MANFNTTLEIRIDWSEMDLFGHVNNVMYFKYLQAARVNYWEKMGLYGSYQESGLGPILASTKCDFLKALHFPGKAIIYSRLAFMRNTSFGFVHEIRNEAGEVCALGEDVVVMFDFKKNLKAPIPEEFRKAAQEIEGPDFQP